MSSLPAPPTQPSLAPDRIQPARALGAIVVLLVGAVVAGIAAYADVAGFFSLPAELRPLDPAADPMLWFITRSFLISVATKFLLLVVCLLLAVALWFRWRWSRRALLSAIVLASASVVLAYYWRGFGRDSLVLGLVIVAALILAWYRQR